MDFRHVNAAFASHVATSVEWFEFRRNSKIVIPVQIHFKDAYANRKIFDESKSKSWSNIYYSYSSCVLINIKPSNYENLLRSHVHFSLKYLLIRSFQIRTYHLVNEQNVSIRPIQPTFKLVMQLQGQHAASNVKTNEPANGGQRI